MNNNEKFIAIKAKYGLTHSQLAAMLRAKTNTTISWTSRESTPNYRRVSDATLLLLDYVLKDMKLKPIRPPKKNYRDFVVLKKKGSKG